MAVDVGDDWGPEVPGEASSVASSFSGSAAERSPPSAPVLPMPSASGEAGPESAATSEPEEGALLLGVRRASNLADRLCACTGGSGDEGGGEVDEDEEKGKEKRGGRGVLCASPSACGGVGEDRSGWCPGGSGGL